MLQEIIVYIILALAIGYMVYFFYRRIKKQHACDKCGLMEAVKKTKS